MINLTKSRDFFNPTDVEKRCHIIGCGSVGGNIAVALVRLGVTKITLWDFDVVESKNLANQIYRAKDIGVKKVDALEEILTDINPDVNIKKKPDGWNEGDSVAGYVFLAVDNIDVRREIVKKADLDGRTLAMFDFRTALTGAQSYAANMSIREDIESFLATMDFSHDEVSETVSACGTTLGVASIPRMIADLGVNNFVNFVKGEELKKVIIMDGFKFNTFAI